MEYLENFDCFACVFHKIMLACNLLDVSNKLIEIEDCCV